MAKVGMPGVLRSMTGFASLSGDNSVARWDWEIRSVNGKGLDVRLRLPDGADKLERDLRSAISQAASRGNVTVTLRVSHHATSGATALNPDGLDAALDSLAVISDAAQARDVALVQVSAVDIATMPGVMVTAAPDRSGLPDGIAEQIPALLGTFTQMREAEGQALGVVLGAQLDEIAALIETAGTTAEARSARAGDLLRQKVAALVDATEQADPARLNQELALLAVKADVTEEIDRLRAHVEAARNLLAKGGPVGRKLDFLMQEFNREANTLCSKSGSTDLTATGLDMKVLIDQMREQVQNLE